MTWMVYSTALCPPTILVLNDETEQYGTITDFSREEWNAAYYAPSNPYPWPDIDRIIATKEVNQDE